MSNNGSTSKIWTFVVACLLLLAITAVAETHELTPPQMLIGAVVNDGPVAESAPITFTGQCGGENTKIVLCRENTICNAQTQAPDLLCASEVSSTPEKICTYATTATDGGLHENDIATCCAAGEQCDTTVALIDPWRVNTLAAAASLTVVDDSSNTVQVIINQRGITTNLQFSNQPITKMLFTNLQGTQIGVSKITRGIVPPEGVEFGSVFGLDLEEVAFTEAAFTATAIGFSLYQCRFWDFALSTCVGTWEFVKTMEQGKEYSFNLAPGSFGFAEATSAPQQQPEVPPEKPPEPPVEGPPQQPIEEPIERPVKQLPEIRVEGPITNDGPVEEGAAITFTGSCNRDNARLMLCKENSICNAQTPALDVICESGTTDEKIKTCQYTTAAADTGNHDADIATCCTGDGQCATTTIVVDPWTVTALPEIIPEIIQEEAKEFEEDMQEPAEINKPVRWIKKVRFVADTENSVVKLHQRATDIKVHKITNKVKEELKLDKWEKNEKPQETEILIKELIKEADIEYSTDPPAVREEVINRYEKKVTISADIHYTNVLAYTTVPDVARQRIKIYWERNGSRELVANVTYLDDNNNGLVDRIEWIVPALSEQTFDIVIVQAEHLDVNRNFIAEIYDYVNETDNVTYTIPENEYARAYFITNLTNENIIDVVVYNSQNSVIEVYEKDSDVLIGLIEIENDGFYATELNHSGSQDAFDLKSLNGDVEYDYIHDARTLTSVSMTANATNIGEGEQITATGVYDTVGTGGAGSWVFGITEINSGRNIDATCSAGDVFQVIATDISSCTQAGGETCSADGNGVVTASLKVTGHTIIWTIKACSGSSGLSPEDVTTYRVSGDAVSFTHATGSITINAPDITLPLYDNITFSPVNETNYSTAQFYEFNATWDDNVQIESVFIAFDDVNYSLGDIYNDSSVYSFNRTGLFAENHNFTWVANDTTGNENQTALELYTVARAEPGVNLTFDDAPANLTVNVGVDVNITADREVGEENIQLFQDEVLINEGNTYLSNLTNFTSIDVFNITTFHPETANFTSNFTTLFITTIDSLAPVVNLTDPKNNNITETETVANITFLSNATDHLELSNATLYHNITETWEANETIDINGTFNETSFSIDVAPTTVFIWNVLYCDSLDNCAFAENNFTVTVQIPMNDAPVINAIDGPGGNTISDQSITEDGVTDLEVTFTVTDDDSVDDIDLAAINLTLIMQNGISGIDDQLNASCGNPDNISGTEMNITCAAEIFYWFNATEWNLTAMASDFSGSVSQNTTNFTLQETTAIIISPNSLSFPPLTINDENTTSDDPITINNTGNDNIDANNTLITGLDLVGEEIDTHAIATGNFSVSVMNGGVPPLECSYIDINTTRLVNNTATNINESSLPAGNRSISGAGVEDLYVCLTLVPPGLPPQAYSTLNSSAGWTVSVV